MLTLLVLRGSANEEGRPPVREVKTDAEGRFSMELPAGDYCIVDDTKRARTPALKPGFPRDETCYAGWLRSCDHTFTLGRAHGERVAVTFSDSCDPPCVRVPPRP